MNCPICGGKVETMLTNLPVELEKGLLYIKEIPADICNQCGEVFISDDIAAELEKLVARAQEQSIEIEVISYQGAA